MNEISQPPEPTNAEIEAQRKALELEQRRYHAWCRRTNQPEESFSDRRTDDIGYGYRR
jgi:hypothetical protein